MRLFGSERVMGMMEKLGVDEDTPIDAKMLSNAIENAQKQVESRNFQTRKNVLQYDDVMNTQRESSTSSAAKCWTARTSSSPSSPCCAAPLRTPSAATWESRSI